MSTDFSEEKGPHPMLKDCLTAEYVIAVCIN